MIHPELLINLFEINLHVVRRQTEGLSHEDSLIQPPFRGNCLNWVLGHIVATRNQIMTLLESQPSGTRNRSGVIVGVQNRL